MDYFKAEELRKLWGNKPCSHPKFEKETHLGWGYVEEKTGDYVCTQCGQDFTKMNTIESSQSAIKINKLFVYGTI